MHMYTLITSKGVPKYECNICIHELSLSTFMRRYVFGNFIQKNPTPHKKQNETKRDSWPHLVLQTYAYHDL